MVELQHRVVSTGKQLSLAAKIPGRELVIMSNFRSIQATDCRSHSGNVAVWNLPGVAKSTAFEHGNRLPGDFARWKMDFTACATTWWIYDFRTGELACQTVTIGQTS
jgi:hypothetical protein